MSRCKKCGKTLYWEGGDLSTVCNCVVQPPSVEPCSSCAALRAEVARLAERYKRLEEAAQMALDFFGQGYIGFQHSGDAERDVVGALTDALGHSAALVNATEAERIWVRKALMEVDAERGRQDAKWGEQNHHAMEWLAILGEEVGEANKAALEAHFKGYGRTGDWSDYRTELIQVAAVAVAMVECLDRAALAAEPEPPTRKPGELAVCDHDECRNINRCGRQSGEWPCPKCGGGRRGAKTARNRLKA